MPGKRRSKQKIDKYTRGSIGVWLDKDSDDASVAMARLDFLAHCKSAIQSLRQIFDKEYQATLRTGLTGTKPEALFVRFALAEAGDPCAEDVRLFTEDKHGNIIGNDGRKYRAILNLYFGGFDEIPIIREAIARWAKRFHLTLAGEPPRWLKKTAALMWSGWEDSSLHPPDSVPLFLTPETQILSEESVAVVFPPFRWDPFGRAPDSGSGAETLAQAKRRILEELERLVTIRLAEIQRLAESKKPLRRIGAVEHYRWLALWNSEHLSLSQIRAEYPHISTNAAISNGILRAARIVGLDPRPGMRGRKRISK